VSTGGGLAFTVKPVGFTELQERTAQFDKTQARLVQRNLRDAGQQILGDIRANVLQGSYGLDAGMRKGIASGLKVETSPILSQPGIRILATAAAMPDGKAAMVAAWQKETFQHPVFGNVGVAVSQEGHPYFYKTVLMRKDKATKAVTSAMQQAGATLAGGSSA
jgi:hypothetical protein